MSLDNNFFKWETPATKYHVYSITNFMANILADKILYSDFSFSKKTKIIISNVTFCLSKDTIAA